MAPFFTEDRIMKESRAIIDVVANSSDYEHSNITEAQIPVISFGEAPPTHSEGEHPVGESRRLICSFAHDILLDKQLIWDIGASVPAPLSQLCTPTDRDMKGEE